MRNQRSATTKCATALLTLNSASLQLRKPPTRASLLRYERLALLSTSIAYGLISLCCTECTSLAICCENSVFPYFLRNSCNYSRDIYAVTKLS